ncbi:TolC family protein [Rhizobium leguminosarum]|uniref:TolC family protein n=1 Tax=Rhizobium TaxID=379 RepID=UPI003D7C1542
MNDYIRKAERHLAAATANIGVAESQALRAQVKITQETLALSIGSYKDGQSSLLDAGCAAFGRDQSGQPGAGGAAMARDYAPNVAIGSGTTSVGPRSGQILMNTEPRAVAAMDKRWIVSDNLPFGRGS